MASCYSSNFSPKKTASSLRCTFCIRKNPPSCRCLTCNNFLCHDCEQSHKFMLCFQEHKLIPIGNRLDLNNNGFKNGSVKMKEFHSESSSDSNWSLFSCNGRQQEWSDPEQNINRMMHFPSADQGTDNPPRDPFNKPISSSFNGLASSLSCAVPPPILDDPAPVTATSQAGCVQIFNTFGQKGVNVGQFHSPHGFCLGFDEDIVVADSANHRIQVFDKRANFKFQFGNGGRHDGYLWHPRKVAILPSRRMYVVCDRGYGRSRMQLFTEEGKFSKKIYIQYIKIVAGITVTQHEDIVVVDSVTPTIFIIGPDDFLRSIDCSRFMEEPSDIVAYGHELFICDFKGHNIVVIDFDGNLLRKIGHQRITNFPNGIDVLPNGNILVGDSHGNLFHISVYSKEGTLINEFRCPFLKVSRCCGLQHNSEGQLITVDKNFHRVIILSRMYLPKGNDL